nr:RecName: Full=Large ribosomal subunit protein uL24; AltName: Full=60S ribosomal protein L26 [Spinacia oleracea]
MKYNPRVSSNRRKS